MGESASKGSLAVAEAQLVLVLVAAADYLGSSVGVGACDGCMRCTRSMSGALGVPRAYQGVPVINSLLQPAVVEQTYVRAVCIAVQ
jgi:hypothetical protein